MFFFGFFGSFGFVFFGSFGFGFFGFEFWFFGFSHSVAKLRSHLSLEHGSGYSQS